MRAVALLWTCLWAAGVVCAFKVTTLRALRAGRGIIPSERRSLGDLRGNLPLYSTTASIASDDSNTHRKEHWVQSLSNFAEKVQDKYLSIFYSKDAGEAKLHKKLDREFVGVAMPAFFSLAADPLASFVDGCYVGRLSVNEQAGMGMAINTQYTVAKVYNDPLIKTSTSLVAGREGKELSDSVSSAILTAVIIGFVQMFCFLVLTEPTLSLMGYARFSPMRSAAARYLKWRALGSPAATVLLVSVGIFRGRGDTITPLKCTLIGNIVNILLDPVLIFNCGMGCAGAGAATAFSQWCAIFPLLYLLNKSIPIKFTGWNQLKEATRSYAVAGSLVTLRTLSKIAAYAYTAKVATNLGPVLAAAYFLTFNFGFLISQFCEAISISAQALLARDIPFVTPRKKSAARHVIWRALQTGVLVSSGLCWVCANNLDFILNSMTATPEVRVAAMAVMPMVLLTQVLKGFAYSTGGIVLGGLDWQTSATGMTISAIVTVTVVELFRLTKAFGGVTVWNIWIALAMFFATQVCHALLRVFSGNGPWSGLYLLGGRFKNWKGFFNRNNMGKGRTYWPPLSPAKYNNQR